MMKNRSTAVIAISATFMCVGALFFLGAHNSTKAKQEKPVIPVITASPELPEQIKIAGEIVDLSRYDMHERYDREITSFSYTHNLTLLIIKRANRYFPIIEPILAREGVPADFIYLCAIESSFNPRAVSSVKASGLWQIMEATGKEYGLEINQYVDERFHVEKSTLVACKYIKKAYHKFGSWMAVAASYNAGMGRIGGELQKQRVDDLFDLWLNEETNRYPFRMMALKELMDNPYRYGYILKSDQLYKPIRFKDVKVKEPIPDLAIFAISHGVTYAQLKEFNPWLRDRSLPNKTGKEYIIKIPLKEDLHYNRKKPIVHQKKWVVD